ncbi:MAG: hypothetical protein NT076_01560 [Candidatus Pacearchaeota archaeon]|nr:hypothetical protein [Candidatus Pacearchaeota archaeon]
MEPLHIKFEFPEVLDSKKTLLSSEINLLNIAKKISLYKKLRVMEIKRKILLRRKMKELSSLLKKLSLELPKTQDIKQAKIKSQETEIPQKLKLEQELKEIREKLASLG